MIPKRWLPSAALRVLPWALCIAGLALPASAASLAPPEYSEAREPCRDRSAIKRPYFGDFHVHTRYSLDANTQGTRTTPAQAYDFARGARIDIQPWTDSGKGVRSLQLSRPLDFAMVSDHAELIGEVYMCNTPGVEGYNAWQCMFYRQFPRGAFYLFNFMSSMKARHMGQCGENDELCLQAARVPWKEMQVAAEKAYDRSAQCSFTTFIGYEWTGVQPGSGGNLHRNIVFRNAEVPELPFSYIDGPSAEQLWEALDTQCIDADNRCDALSIPHNSNMSAGHMFAQVDSDGSALTAELARQRIRLEPVMEVMQHKGASECYYKAGLATDELCAFEQLPRDNIAGFNNPPQPDTGFLREVLAKGLTLQRELGVNPYRLGVIASTDTHLGTPGAAQEDNYLGHGGDGVPARNAVPPGLPDHLEYNPGGLAVIWAHENSRDALFEGLKNRETYGTSGPRIVSRFFGADDFPSDLCEQKDHIQHAYANGVPMGSALLVAEGGKPTFLVAAGQDPGTDEQPATPLQRVQIIKGKVTAQGQYQEKVVDVAGSAHNGATVDLQTCQTSGPGYAQLCGVWTDEDFNPHEQAFYYTRVIENPTCRWSQRICAAHKVDCNNPATIGDGLEGCCAAEHRPVIQERAWSSPIWYEPADS
ncbi:MAG: DUF3604 domain-containing protein [Gammaproteobacteria bacterium]|nr:DUF3604 domain-containing protein [Gammaproteobacteria bacterium]